MKKVLLLLLLISSKLCFCQCIDKSKIGFGGELEMMKYQYLCPVFKFVNNGDTSKHWIYINNIDMRQIAKEIDPIKSHVEYEIKKYAGNVFWSRLKFSEVDIVYPDSLKQFIERGNRNATIKYCKAKYYFFYNFMVDSNVSYIIGIAVNKKKQIISKFHFPSKSQYVPVSKNFTVCKAIEIARNINKNIDPIDKIIVDYDNVKHRFYWLISQKIMDTKEGENDVNQVYIDAANPKIAKILVGKALIVF